MVIVVQSTTVCTLPACMSELKPNFDEHQKTDGLQYWFAPCQAWVFFLSHERSNTSCEEQKLRQRWEDRKKRMWGCSVNNTYPRHRTWFIWEAWQKKSSSHSQMATQSKANVKRTRLTVGAPVEKSTARRTRWIYRWLYVHWDDGKPITNVSVSYYFQGLWIKTLCVRVLRGAQMMPSLLDRMFIFAVKYRSKTSILCLVEIKSDASKEDK